MTNSRPATIPCLPIALLAGLLVAASPARAQDSFVREADFLTGRPLLSVLGSGLGEQPASLTLEFSCPGREVWTLDLHGAAFPDGAPITFDLGGAGSGWHEVRLLAVQRPDPDRLRLAVDEASFRTALVRVNQAEAPREGAAAVLQVGRALGVAVGLDALAREIGDLARDCATPRSPPGRAGGPPFARYAR